MIMSAAGLKKKKTNHKQQKAQHPKLQSSKLSDLPKLTLDICLKFPTCVEVVKHLPQHFAGSVPIQKHIVRTFLELGKLLPDNYKQLSLCGLLLSLRKGQQSNSQRGGEEKVRLGWAGLGCTALHCTAVELHYLADLP